MTAIRRPTIRSSTETEIVDAEPMLALDTPLAGLPSELPAELAAELAEPIDDGQR